MQRWKPVDTADVPILDVVEGTGKLSGLAASFVVQWGDGTSKVGAGTLPHAERRDVWKNRSDYVGKVIQVRYKPDYKFGGMREPRFERWRPDKVAA